MAAASDKARFYLEKYVPELQEYERKQIFSREEISAITAKRSDFEHTLNARGSRPEDYLQYVAYEMNLDRLRRLRCNRKGVKATTFNGQRTIFFIFDRATKKFPGSIDLWVRYIEFCKKEKANKKLAKIFTSVLRLHPRNWSFWVLAAKYYAETQADMATARSYLQRALRFCKDEKRLYLEYTKLEMVYLAKLAARRKILGLDDAPDDKQMEDSEDMIALPTVLAEEMDPEARKGVEEVNAEVLQRLAAAPAFTGAIPIAIYDAALKQFSSSVDDVADDFFDLVATFETVPATRKILQHIMDSLPETDPKTPGALVCHCKFALFDVQKNDPEFPLALGRVLASIRQGMSAIPEGQQSDLALKTISMLLPYLRVPGEMDEDVLLVIEATITRCLRLITRYSSTTRHGSKTDHTHLLRKLRDTGRATDASNLEAINTNLGSV